VSWLVFLSSQIITSFQGEEEFSVVVDAPLKESKLPAAYEFDDDAPLSTSQHLAFDGRAAPSYVDAHDPEALRPQKVSGPSSTTIASSLPSSKACPVNAKPFATSFGNQVLDECMIRPPNNSTVTVCLVHVGDDISHGMHSFFAIAQLRRSNPNVDIVWILSRKVADIPSVKAVAECYAVNIIVLEVLEAHPSTSNEIAEFRRVCTSKYASV
jgi:hypothetical protein